MKTLICLGSGLLATMLLVPGLAMAQPRHDVPRDCVGRGGEVMCHVRGCERFCDHRNDNGRHNGPGFNNGNGHHNGPGFNNGNGHHNGPGFNNGNGHHNGPGFNNGNGHHNGPGFNNGHHAAPVPPPPAPHHHAAPVPPPPVPHHHPAPVPPPPAPHHHVAPLPPPPPPVVVVPPPVPVPPPHYARIDADIRRLMADNEHLQHELGRERAHADVQYNTCLANLPPMLRNRCTYPDHDIRRIERRIHENNREIERLRRMR